MTVSTLRPSATTVNTGAVTGAGSAHAALSDNSDSSYVTFDHFEQFNGPLSDLTLPAGAVVKSIALRVRCSATMSGAGSIGNAGVNSGDGISRVGPAGILVNWAVPTTVTVVTGAASWSDSDVDGADAGLLWYAPGGGPLRLHELYVDVTYVAKPVVSVSAPTGTVTNTNLPTVTWADTLDSEGGAQSAFQVWVYNDAQYGAGGFAPGVSTPFDANLSGITFDSSTSWTVNTILPDDTYRAYVRVAQTVNGVLHWSDWAYSGFVVDVALPAEPTASFSAAAYLAATLITLAPNSGDATTDAFELQRSTDGGATWEALRQTTAGPIPAEPYIELYDFEAPNGVEVTYRARALHSYSGVYAGSDWITDASTWTSPTWWLKHPNQPGLNGPIEIQSFDTLTRAARQGTFQPLGATAVVVVSDTRAPAAGQITFLTPTVYAQAALDAIVDANATLFLDGPPDEGPPGYVRLGGLTRKRVADRASFAGLTLDTFDFTVVPRPTGNMEAFQ